MYTKTRGVSLVLKVNCAYCHKVIFKNAVEVQTTIQDCDMVKYYHFMCYNKVRKQEST